MGNTRCYHALLKRSDDDGWIKPAPVLSALAIGVNTTRVYNQVERLGNPLVSEVFLAKRSHSEPGRPRG